MKIHKSIPKRSASIGTVPIETSAGKMRICRQKIRKHGIFGKKITSVPIFFIFFVPIILLSNVPASGSTPNKWWEVYFTAGDNTSGNASVLEAKVKAFLAATQSHAAVMTYTWGKSGSHGVVEAANDLSPAISVQIVYDGDKGTHDSLEAGIPKVGDPAGTPIMHNKAIIRDTGTANVGLLMGSGNYTESGWEGQNNTFMFIYD